MSIPFLDEESQNAIQWDSIWAEYAPVTPYGKAAKAALRPFLPGSEDEVVKQFHRLKADDELLTDAACAEIEKQLAQLPDIRGALSELANQGTSLGPKSLLQLKQFAHYGFQLNQATEKFGLAWTTRHTWRGLLDLFGDDTPTFSVEAVAGEDYRRYVTTHAARLGKLHQLQKEVEKAIFDLCGERSNRDREVFIPLPAKRQIATGLKANPKLKWLRDTPFESVFEWVMTDEMCKQAEQVEEAQRDLETYTDEVLQRLCDALRAHLPTWKWAARQLAEFDLRIARVSLLRTWGGAIPELGPWMRLTEGWHPLVQRRLSERGSQYVPLTLDVSYGASVLCGSNMGGKTVAMSLLFICQALAQFGLPVPAREFCTPLFQFVRFASSAETDVENGLSSFGKEITRIQEIWRVLESAESALVFCDEPGRSTNPLEGEALTVGLLQSLKRMKSPSLVLFVATHFSQAVHVEGVHKFRVKGLRELGIDAGGEFPLSHRLHALERAMDYTVESLMDDEPSTEALTIAKWLGLSDTVLELSRDYLRKGR